MAVTKREDRKFKFETLQLHVGQEQPDPATRNGVNGTYSYAMKNGNIESGGVQIGRAHV